MRIECSARGFGSAIRCRARRVDGVQIANVGRCVGPVSRTQCTGARAWASEEVRKMVRTVKGDWGANTVGGG